jgi:hypothetical protein
MASRPAPVTRASGGGESDGGGKKFLGVNRTTAIVVGGAALGLGLLYFYFKGKQQTPGQGGGQGNKAPGSPTGLRREDIFIHLQDHGRHHRHGGK